MTRNTARAARSDGGFTLVEVVVAMVLVGLLAMAFLPLALRASTAAADGTTLATASRLASKHLEAARETPLVACPTTGPEPLGTVRETVTDARGVQLQAWAKYIGPCTAPGTVTYEVSVTRSSAPAAPLATATTHLLVPAW